MQPAVGSSLPYFELGWNNPPCSQISQDAKKRSSDLLSIRSAGAKAVSRPSSLVSPYNGPRAKNERWDRANGFQLEAEAPRRGGDASTPMKQLRSESQPGCDRDSGDGVALGCCQDRGGSHLLKERAQARLQNSPFSAMACRMGQLQPLLIWETGGPRCR